MSERIYAKRVWRQGRGQWRGYVTVRVQDDSPFPHPLMELRHEFMGSGMDERAFTEKRLRLKLDKLIEWDQRCFVKMEDEND